jgi:hypothetical protein
MSGPTRKAAAEDRYATTFLKHSSPVFIAVLSTVAFGQIPIDENFAE